LIKVEEKNSLAFFQLINAIIPEHHKRNEHRGQARVWLRKFARGCWSVAVEKRIASLMPL